MGSSPHVPVLQVDQLVPEGSDGLEPGLKNEKNNRFSMATFAAN